MAIGRLSMKIGKVGKAGPHAAYIAREGQYASRLDRGEKLEAAEAGNMPAWAKSNPQQFWQAADAFERINGTTYREMEIALPRELNANRRAALVREFVRQEIGSQHAYQWAIHTPMAADEQEQPHLHLMFSERQLDDIERDPEQYFKRYNAKAREKGGARKGFGPRAGQTLSKAERTAELQALRGRWEVMCNAHLEQAGVAQRIDMRSHAERGTGLDPERKQLPSQWRGLGRDNVLEFRQARAELTTAHEALASTIPDVRAEVINLQAERQRRELEKVQQAQERQRLEGMNSRELAKEIVRLRPLPVPVLVAHDPAVIQADQDLSTLQERQLQGQSSESQAKREAERWRQAHSQRAKAHDAGWFRSSYLDERAKTEAEARQDLLVVAPLIEDATQHRQHVRSDTEERITVEQKPILARLAELEKMQKERTRQEREAEALRLAEQQRHRIAEKFERLAQKRQSGLPGYRDSSHAWQAMPQQLRDLIDAYNRQSEGEQAARLAHIRDNPAECESVARLLRRHERGLEPRGLSN